MNDRPIVYEDVTQQFRATIAGKDNWVSMPTPPPVVIITTDAARILEALAGDLGITEGYHTKLDQKPSVRHLLDSLSIAYVAKPEETAAMFKRLFDTADIFDRKYGVDNDNE